MESHSLSLSEIDRQADPPEQSYEDVQGNLHSLQVPGAQEYIIHVEHAQDLSQRVYQSVLDDWSVLHQQQEPMSDQNSDHHVEEGGIYQPPLIGAAGRPELGAMASAMYCDQILVIPELLQIPRIFGTSLQPSKVCRRRPQSNVS